MSNEELERQLFLKQLQINRLLDITQAINNNVKAEGLFDMYKSFLNWELGVRRMALFIPKTEGGWSCATHIGVDEKSLKADISPLFQSYGNALRKINVNDHPVARHFEMVIPVFHKDEPIAYAFIGGHDATDFGKIQMITTITNIIAVAIENKRLFKRQIEQERFNHEMKLAGEMQLTLVPSKLPQNGCFEVDAIYQPHFGVGGDYFDCFRIQETHYLFIVADISGKGFAAALLMANFQANLRAIIRQTNSPEEFIRQINRAVQRITKSDKYITLFVCDFDTETRILRYINAGHIPPILVQNGESRFLTEGCSIIGYFKTLPSVEVGEIEIKNDGMLVIFTDGITDVRNPQGSFFDEAMLSEFVLKNRNLKPVDFNLKLMKKIDRFKGIEDYPDDITVLTCRFLKK